MDILFVFFGVSLGLRIVSPGYFREEMNLKKG